MNVDSLSKFEPFVSRNVRLRGAAYAADGRVTIEAMPAKNDGLLEAAVAGSEVYRVALREDGTAIDVRCDCPHFEREMEVCKHIWATIVEATRLRAFGDQIFREIEVDDEIYDTYDKRPGYPTHVPVTRHPLTRPAPSRGSRSGSISFSRP